MYGDDGGGGVWAAGPTHVAWGEGLLISNESTMYCTSKVGSGDERGEKRFLAVLVDVDDDNNSHSDTPRLNRIFLWSDRTTCDMRHATLLPCFYSGRTVSWHFLKPRSIISSCWMVQSAILSLHREAITIVTVCWSSPYFHLLPMLLPDKAQ